MLLKGECELVLSNEIPPEPSSPPRFSRLVPGPYSVVRRTESADSVKGLRTVQSLQTTAGCACSGAIADHGDGDGDVDRRLKHQILCHRAERFHRRLTERVGA